MGAGPADAPYVESALADRGRSVWAGECINCHGTQARGTDNGPNLTRSMVVLRDRYGSELGPFLKKGHKMQSGATSTTLTDDQVVNLAHFLRQRVNDSFRGSPLFQANSCGFRSAEPLIFTLTTQGTLAANALSSVGRRSAACSTKKPKPPNASATFS